MIKNLAFMFIFCFFVVSAEAIIISPYDRGLYDSAGFHDSSNKNTFSGFQEPMRYDNSFSVFDLSAYSIIEFSVIQEALVIEAEDASIKTVGGPTSDGWNLWSNGTLGEFVDIPKLGIYEVVVRAFGSSLGGIWPEMALTVDDIDRETVTIDSAEYTDYKFQDVLTPGVHTIGVSFLNDDWNPEVEDRNLYLDRLTIISSPGTGKPKMTNFEQFSQSHSTGSASGLNIFNDPETGDVYGSATIYESDVDSLIYIPESASQTNYYFHIASFRSESRAIESAKYLKQYNVTTFIHWEKVTNKGDWYLVYLGPYPTREQLVQVSRELMDKKVILDAADQYAAAMGSHIEFSVIQKALTIEAEDASIKTVGVPFGDGWNLWSEGTLGEFVDIPELGTYGVVVRAFGSSLGGIWPEMALTVDGIAGETVTIDSVEYTDYEFQVFLSPGVHTIGVSFLNDDWNPEVEDRNLFLDRLTIISPHGTDKPEISSQ